MRRAMSSQSASYKKKRGHINEYHFATLIEGKVINFGKTDVLDNEGNTYSVKSSKWWQIFLYSKERFLSNTEFLGIGDITNSIVNCLNVFPDNWEEYKSNKNKTKYDLILPMRDLMTELNKNNVFSDFLLKGIFNGNEVNFLAILPKQLSDTSIPLEEKYFHIFHSSDVVAILSKYLEITNSVARNRNQVDSQKVVFRHNKRNVGHIEIRSDSKIHYRRMVCRFDGTKILGILKENLDYFNIYHKQVSAYGKAKLML